MLLDRGANVSACDRWGNTPLHFAASRGHELVLKVLLEAGARWDAPGDEGATPLHVAASAGFTSCLSRFGFTYNCSLSISVIVVKSTARLSRLFPCRSYILKQRSKKR